MQQATQGSQSPNEEIGSCMASVAHPGKILALGLNGILLLWLATGLSVTLSTVLGTNKIALFFTCQTASALDLLRQVGF